MSRPIFRVAGREISERTRSRAFLISTLTIVAVVLAAVIVPGLTDSTTHVGLTGATPAALPAALRDSARATDVRLQLRRYPTLTAGTAAVRDGDADVLIVAGRRLVWKAQPDAQTAGIVSSAAPRLRFEERARQLGLEPAQTLSLLAPAALPERRLQAADPDQDARETIAMVTYLLLLMMVLWYGNAVADGIAQEKGGRIMELLVSRISGRDLLAGKVLGIGAVGLAQMLLALITAGAAILALDTVDVPDAVPATLASAVLWFVLGYLFWSVAYASVAALVSRVEDLQAAVAPVGWVLVLSALTAPVASEVPHAWYMVAASLFPTTAPFVMPVRIAVSDVAPWEMIAAATIMLAATYALVRLAGAVYSGALLRTGARPRLRDVWTTARSG